MPKFSEKIDGNELDLSLNDLTEVPVQDLAHMPKATHLDLSCNKISVLPKNFPTLTHLVKIDLSKNVLKELPQNFGNLSNLQYLDLYGNNISTLPISFCRLKKLKWLDLKNNPLDPELKAIAGDCLDQKQCQSCAKDVVSFLQGIESEMERLRQKKLNKERMKEQARLARQARQLEEQRLLKKAERERRKEAAKARSNQAHNQREELKTDDPPKIPEKEIQPNPVSGSSFFTCLRIFFKLFFMVMSGLITAYIVSKSHQIKSSEGVLLAMKELYVQLQDIIAVWWQAFVLPWYSSLYESLKETVPSVFQ